MKFKVLLSIGSFIRSAYATLWRVHRLQIKRVVALLLLLVPTTLIASELAPIAQENKVKAVYIFNFIRFTEWPSSSKAPAAKQTNLFILGERPLLKRLQGKAFQKTTLETTLNTRSCDDIALCVKKAKTVFIASSQKKKLQEILSSLLNRPILTISDIPKFAEQGGMVELKRYHDKIIFRINLQAVKRANLYISSQLLQMGEIVENKP